MLIPSIPRYVSRNRPRVYLERQAEIAAQANGPYRVPSQITYTGAENATWARAQDELAPLWDRYVASELLAARDVLGLPVKRIPQLTDVSDRLHSLTGFRYGSVPGTVAGHEFFGALARRTFSSTQYIRWDGDPDYTPEPDVLHEVGGHAVSLAHPQLAELHALAGRASVAAPTMLSAIAAVFWYSIEFGVIAAPTTSHGEWKAYGTGLLSSPGELGWFAKNAEIRPLSIAEMISTPYDISSFQPILFGAESLDHVVETVGAFYSDVISCKGIPCLT